MDEEVRDLLEQYQYLKKYHFLYVPRDDYYKFENDDKVTVDDTSASVFLLHRILSNDYYYSYTQNVFDQLTGEFVYTYIIHGDTGAPRTYTRSDLFYLLDEYADIYQMNAIEKERYENLWRSVSITGLKEHYAGVVIPITVDGIDYEVKFEDILELLSFDDEQFDKLCFDSNIKDFHGIKKEHFVYAAYRFIKDDKLMDNYVLPEEMVDRVYDITSMQMMDVEAYKSPTDIKGINGEYDVIDEAYEKLKVDEGLKNAILSGMDANFTDIEKAIYIYIMMCKTLTYDEEYYAVNQTGPATEKHKKKEYIEEITLDNNEVVCFEFDLIYSKFLNDLGIPFHINNESFDNEYGEAHANIQFRCGKFLVSADSVTSILRGDMTNAKIGKFLAGLKCLNQNESTREEFRDALNHVYSYIKERDKKRRPLSDIVREYRESTNSIVGVPLYEKMDILLSRVRSAELAPIDDYSYIMELRKILFTPEEQKENFIFTIMRDPKQKREGKTASTSAIFTINELGFSNPDGVDEYYYYKPHEEVRRIGNSELLDMLAYGDLEYIKADSVEIPGFETEGKSI